MSKLQKECAKYLNSEGIYYRKTKSGILACINRQFVMFEFEGKIPVRKLKASGGLCYRPCSLSNFIGMVYGGEVGENCVKITHWMPLPEPPKGE